MMYEPKIGQTVMLIDPRSIDNEREFEVVAVHSNGKLVDLRKPHAPWRLYTVSLSKLMDMEQRS